MDAIEAITQRVSVAQLTGPEITTTQKEILFRAALRAPDHAWIRPSRYLTIEGQARASLGEVFLAGQEAAQRSSGGLSEEKREKLRNMLLRAPLVIVAITKVVEHPKVPRDELILSTGAGVQNMLNVAYALGLGAIWRTGDMVHCDEVKAALGLAANEVITGFIYVGHPNTSLKPVPEMNVTEFVAEWRGETI